MATVDTPGTVSKVAISGTHAYVAGTSGIQVIDITNPQSAQIVGSVDTPGSALDVAVSGAHAYVGDQSSGLQVIDITNPQNPQIVGSVNTPGFAAGVVLSGTHAYVADWTFGLQVIDITNPQSPEIVASVPTPADQGVAVSSMHAYVLNQFTGLQVIDITNPQSPQIVGGIPTRGNAYGLAVSGDFAYVAENNDGMSPGALLVLPAQCSAATSAGHDVGQGPRQAGPLWAWPNPAVESVALSFAVPSEQNPSLRIYDVSGRHIRTLVTESRSSGEQELLWDGKDDQGRSLASGTYFVRLLWAQGSATSQVRLLR